MKTRLLVIVAIVVVWGLLAILFSDFSPLRVARVTATPTRTPKATFTATATPTVTLTPSATPTPSDTPTPTPTPTDTPLPTATHTPTSTPTPTATPTPTPIPTSTPTASRQPPPAPTRPPTNTPPPQPTNTPAPPFIGSIITGWPNCGTKGVQGYITHADGAPYSGVIIGIWSNAWQGALSGPSELDGKYTADLNNVPAGDYQVAVVNPDTCSTGADGQKTAINCRRLSNVVGVTVFEISECRQTGTVQWAEVHFRGP